MDFSKSASRRLGVALAAVLGTFLAACSSTSSTGRSATTSTTPAATAATNAPAASSPGKAASGNPIVIGGTLGITGSNSGPSAGYLAAAKYWQQQVNASGGLLGRQVELKIYDDESNQATAQQLYQQLIDQDHADLLLAPFSTAIGGAVVPLAARAGKVMFNGGFVSKQLHQKYKSIISSWTYQDTEYSKAFFDMLASQPDSQKPKTIAIVTAQATFTLAALNGFEGKGGALDYAKSAGLKVVFNEKYDAKSTNLTSMIQQAKASGADTLLALTLPNDGFLIAKTVYQVGYHPRFYCSCGAEVISLPNWKSLGDGAFNVYSTTLSSPKQNAEGLDDLSKHLQATLGYASTPAYAIAGYAALQVLQQAVEGAKTLDQKALWNYIQGKSFSTAAGTLKYDSDDGTVDFAGLLTQFQKEKGDQVVWPADVSTSEVVIP
jgi:branched-chain amino acid transport system substrate-binding protein